MYVQVGTIVIDTAMATRDPSDTKMRKKNVPNTEFQLYIRYVSRRDNNVLDLTEYRLIRMMKKSFTVSHRQEIERLIEDYRQGKIAIAWRGGAPVYINSTNG